MYSYCGTDGSRRVVLNSYDLRPYDLTAHGSRGFVLINRAPCARQDLSAACEELQVALHAP